MELIRKAEEKDIDSCIKLLKQVCSVHAKIRPDLFCDGKTKYTEEDLKLLFKDPNKPVFVYEENNEVLGYSFSQIIILDGVVHPSIIKTLYIDDICVDENSRGKHVGKKLFDYTINYARDINCHNVTLNVWEGNDIAKKFYQSMGMSVQKETMEIIL